MWGRNIFRINLTFIHFLGQRSDVVYDFADFLQGWIQLFLLKLK